MTKFVNLALLGLLFTSVAVAELPEQTQNKKSESAVEQVADIKPVVREIARRRRHRRRRHHHRRACYRRHRHFHARR